MCVLILFKPEVLEDLIKYINIGEYHKGGLAVGAFYYNDCNVFDDISTYLNIMV